MTPLLNAKRALYGIIAIAMLIPDPLYAEGISLLADLEYFYTAEKATIKETGTRIDAVSSRWSQLYQLGLSRFVLPTLSFDIGGSIEDDSTSSSLKTINQPDDSFDSKSTTITVRPYIEVDLITPIYKTGVAYRERNVEISRGPGRTEDQNLQEYFAVLNWRPVDFPFVNLTYQRFDLQRDRTTNDADATRENVNLTSKYQYKDLLLDYIFLSQKQIDNLDNTGSQINSHNGRARFSRAFNYKNNQFDVDASARIIYNETNFISDDTSDNVIDIPAASRGNAFYVSPDATFTTNEPLDINLIGPGTRLTDINIGRDGGTNPVSAGLSFGSPVELETVYIGLSQNTDAFPNLASTSQVAAIADAYNWRFYSSDEQTELVWTEQPIASAIYNSVDNRFEIRLVTPINTRRVKVTTIPLTVIAPGEIRYDTIVALTTVAGQSGQEPETLDQIYNWGLRWIPGARTVVGYEGNFRDRVSQPDDFQRRSWTHSLYFRHDLSRMFNTYGRVSLDQRTQNPDQETEENDDLIYSFGIRADYLETLNQTLTFSGTSSSGTDVESTSTNSIVLRTNADLYSGWSAFLDFGVSLNDLGGNEDQQTRFLRLGTTVEPNDSIDLSLDYSQRYTDQTGLPTSRKEFGALQFLWSLTSTINVFFRYDFRDESDGISENYTYLRDFNVNWRPFPGGAFQFSLGYTESIDFAEQKFKTINPRLIWKIADKIFLDLRYNTGTVDSPIEESDLDSFIGKLRISY